MADEWLTPGEVAKLLRVSPEVVRQWCIRHENGEQGGLPSVHFGAVPYEKARRLERRISKADLDAFIESRRHPAPAPAPEPRRWVPVPVDYGGTRTRR